MALENEQILTVKISAFENELTILESDLKATPPCPFTIDAQIHGLRAKYQSMEETHIKVLQKLVADGKQQELLAEEKKRGDHFRRLQIAEGKVSKKLAELNPVDQSTAAVIQPPPKADGFRIALPQKKLPQFGGDVREWLSFWAAFQQIDEDGGLTDAEKFQYLLQCITLNSTARKLIDSFPVNSKNYPAAVEALKAHYGRDTMLVKVYVRDLLQLVIQNALDKGKVELMELVPKLSSQIRNLEELGVTSDKCEDILYPVVESCLPEEVLLAWQRNAKYEEKLDPIMAFLSSEVTNKMDRTLARMDFGMTSSSSLPANDRKGKGKFHHKSGDIPAAAALMAVNEDKAKQSSKKQKCAFCEKGHDSRDCGKAKTQMTHDQLLEVVRDKHLCFQCLKSGHGTKQCKAFVRCAICGKRHYEILCSERKSPEAGKQYPPPPTAASHNMMTTNYHQQQPPYNVDPFGVGNYQQQQQHSSPGNRLGLWNPVQVPVPQPNPIMPPQQQQRSSSAPSQPDMKTGMTNISSDDAMHNTLHTLLVKVVTPRGSAVVRAFIDDGSNESYVTSHIAETGGCKQTGSKTFTHQLFGGTVTGPVEHKKYQLTLQNINGTESVTANFYGVERIAHRIRKPLPGNWKEDLMQRGVLVHDQTNATADVQIMIGMGVAAQIWTGGFLRINPYFIAKETILGWVVGGGQEETEPVDSTNSHMVTSMMIDDLNPQNLWALDILGIKEEPSTQSKADLEAGALEYFRKTTTRQPDGRYEVGLPWIEGHEEVKNNHKQAVAQLHRVTKQLKEEKYFEDYDAIFKQWKEDGIIEEVDDQDSLHVGYYMPHRHVVKESSATTPLRPVFNASAKAKGSVSLNDCLVKGPNMLELIPAINMRFRRNPVGAVSDVKKAFLQMSIAPKDRDFVRFIWWEDNSCRKIKIFRHKRVVFGVRPSPFLLAATILVHLEAEGHQYPEETTKLLNSLYVDNSVTSHTTMEEALEFQRISQQLLTPARFDLRGWEFGPSLEDKVVPVLGMNWHTKDDVLSLGLDNTKKKLVGATTKRGLLSIVNSVFDPMGFVCPFTLAPKLLFQQCCIKNLTWDEQLPEEIMKKLDKWKGQVAELVNFRIPRWMACNNENEAVSLHTFSDGSSSAYATSVFIRTERDDKVCVQLIVAKTRVVPKDKKMTIPRVELMGCLIGARLTREVKIALRLADVPEHYWTDSTTALAWIQHDKPWGRFVQGRVNEIRRLTRTEDWSHVPGELNPADLPSRGCSAAQLLESKWWEGPEWLSLSTQFWPVSSATPDSKEVQQEMKKAVVSCLNVQKEEEDYILQQLVKHSDFNKSLQVIAVMQRYICRVREVVAVRKTGKDVKLKSGEIQVSTAEEIEAAELLVIKLIQQSAFSGPDDKRLKGMSAFVDKSGIIRIKSQLLFGHDDYNVRCPVVLPNDHEMVKLLIRKEHWHNSHAGVQTLQAILRERYWILQSRRTVRAVIKDCVRCRLFLAKKCEVPGAPLPLDRVRDTFAFNVTGVDLAGPLFLRGGTRVWIVLFTDAVYRGIHLELVETLSTDGFISSFRRFIARRGRPSIVYSDNGLNFVGCSNLFRHVDWEKVTRYAAVQKISWKFNPPTAAWWGGWWERMVGLVKTLLRRILGKQVVNLDQLHTIVCDVEATVNKRPLTFLSDSDGELQPLCPVNFMRDNPSVDLPEADAVEHYSLKKGIRACQFLREKLRARFRRDYLAQLQHHAGNKSITVKPGDVVLIEVDDKKRLDWPWGVVQEVYTGRDKKIHRTALVKTKSGCFLRPVQRLFILEAAKVPKEEETLKEAEPKPEEETQQQVTVPEPVKAVPEAIVIKTKSGRKSKKPDRLGI